MMRGGCANLMETPEEPTRSPGRCDEPFAIEYRRREPPPQPIENDEDGAQNQAKLNRGVDHIERHEHRSPRRLEGWRGFQAAVLPERRWPWWRRRSQSRSKTGPAGA